MFLSLMLLIGQLPSLQQQCRNGQCGVASPFVNGWTDTPNIYSLYRQACSPTRAEILRAQGDIIFLQQQYKQLNTLSDKMVLSSLESNDTRVKYIATLVAGNRSMPNLKNEMLTLLQDPNALVRQGARRYLCILTADMMYGGKEWRKLKTKPKHLDFGPSPCCTPEQAAASAKLWKAWWEEQDAILKTLMEKDKELEKRQIKELDK